MVPADPSQRERPWPATRLDETLLFLALATLYVIAGKIGFRAAYIAEQVSPVWPPSALALWAVLQFGRRAWPAIWVGAFVTNATTHVPLI